MATNRKRKKLSIEEKITVIETVGSGQSQRSVAKLFDVSKTQVQHIIATKDELLLEYQESLNNSQSRPKRHRKTNNEEINEATLKWYHERRSQNLPVSGTMLQEKALELSRLANNETFKASNGWLHAFIKRNGIVLKECNSNMSTVIETTTKSHDDSAITSSNTASATSHKLPSTSSDFVTDTYQVQDIFNFIETTILYRAVPDEKLASLVEESKKGIMATERITIGLCCNLTGNEKEMPLVIGAPDSENDFCGLNPDNLPVTWETQDGAWMTTELFDKWLTKFDTRMKMQGRKTLLWVENSPCHKVNNPDITSVRIMYYPQPQLQPLCRGIIDYVKSSYRQFLLQEMLVRRYQHKSMDQMVRSVDIIDACYWLNYSWEKITSEQIIYCWQQAGFPVVCATTPAQRDHNLDRIAQITLNILKLEGVSLEDFYNCDLDLPTHSMDDTHNLAPQQCTSASNSPPDKPTINSYEEASELIQKLKQFAAIKNNASILNAAMSISKEINWQVAIEND